MSDGPLATDRRLPDEIVDRFCIVGPVEIHIERMQQLKALGVDQFAIYLFSGLTIFAFFSEGSSSEANWCPVPLGYTNTYVDR